MTDASLVWGSPAWSWAALALAGVVGVTLLWSYWRAPSTSAVKLIAGSLKALGVAGLALCLVEPLLCGTRARRGANIFAILADNSQSMAIHDRGQADSRGEAVRKLLSADSKWQKQLDEDFDARRFAFDAHLRSIDAFGSLAFDGARSSLTSTLNSVSRRFRGLPLAGVLLVTDGNATDAAEVAWDKLPPVYPIVVGGGESPVDLSLAGVTVSQTNFESAPVTVRADVRGSGLAGQTVVAKLLGDDDKELQTQTVELPAGDEPLALRFQLRPEHQGVNFYRVCVSSADAAKPHGGSRKRRRPRWPTTSGWWWSTAAAGRIACSMCAAGRIGNSNSCGALCGMTINWIWSAWCALPAASRSFPSAAKRANRPIRCFAASSTKTRSRPSGTISRCWCGSNVEENELRDGFPKTAEELYKFDAVILDDIEAAFFSQDQLTLLSNFVSRRGGGLLMLGGPDSFAAGRYARTPVGNLLPVYVDQDVSKTVRGEHEYRLALTREGWLQPWVRTRQTEPEERDRLASMTAFRTLTPITSIKPAATMLAEVVDEAGEEHPALVTQRFGADVRPLY